MFKSGASGNPGGKPLPERLAVRTIQDAFRDLADPVDIGNSLLTVFSGKDPFIGREKIPDHMPQPMSVPIDWQHRLAAMKMYLEYGYGKPVQGHTIQAQIEATQKITIENSHVAELRELVTANPAAAALLEQLANTIVTSNKSIGTPMTVIDIPAMLPLILEDADDE